MIKIITGDDRVRAGQEIKKCLGSDYEIIEGSDLRLEDLPSLFFGTTLFADTRNILVRDLSTNKPVFERLPDYLNTPHNIIIQELKLDKRSTTYKAIKGKIPILDYKIPENPNFRLVFDIYKVAKHDGPKALRMLEQIKPEEDPIRFTGLLASQAIKDYSHHQEERRVLKELAKLDLQMKSTTTNPWLLVESFILKLSTI